MFCPNCGTNNDASAKFCKKCGTPLERRGAQTQPEPAPQPEPEPAPQPAPAPQPQPQPQAAPKPKPARPKWLIPVIAGVAALVLVIFAVVGLFAGGGGSPTPTPANQQVLDDGSWTILTYMCGSDLETSSAFATQNIEELLSVDLPSNVNMLVETGGSNTWEYEGVDENYLEYFAVEKGDLARKKQLTRASMGDPNTLTDFVRWGVENYPAEHYVLIFWDHGGGSLIGVCKDELDGDSLTLPDMNEALGQAGVHFDVIGFDTCVMSTLETAQMLSQYGDYMVASEETIPGGGWSYDQYPKWFSDAKNTDDVEDFCVNIVDTYVDKCEQNDVGEAITLSVTDLTKIDELADAFNLAAEAMARSTERAGTLQHLVVKGDDAQSYGFANYVSGYLDMVDLGDLLTCMDDTLTDESAAVHDALDDVVVYERHGETVARSTGLSIFYPLNIDEETYEKYKAVSEELGLNNDVYLQYLAVRTGVYSAKEWEGKGIKDLDPVTESDAIDAFKYAGKIDERGAFQVVITGNTEFVQVATYQFGQVQPDGSVVPLGSGNYLGLDIDEKGQITYTDEFAGEVLNIGGAYAYAEIVDMVAENDKPSYNLFSVPVEVTRTLKSGDVVSAKTNLLVMYDYDTNEYSLVCYYQDVDESGMAGKSIDSMLVGDQVKFLVAREVDGKVQTGNMGTITLSNDTEVKAIPPGGETSYVYQIVITDIFGQKYEPVSALISFKDGKRTGAQLLE